MDDPKAGPSSRVAADVGGGDRGTGPSLEDSGTQVRASAHAGAASIAAKLEAGDRRRRATRAPRRCRT